MKKVVLILFLLTTLLFFGEKTTNNSTSINYPYLLKTFENNDIKLKIYIDNVKNGIFNQTVLRLKILNLTNSVLKIVWDECTFTDNYNNNVVLIHENQKYISSDLHQIPSVILPNDTFNEIAVPKSHIYYYTNLSTNKYNNLFGLGSGWKIKSINSNIKNRKLLFTYMINDIKKNIIIKTTIPNTSDYLNYSDTKIEKIDIATLSFFTNKKLNKDGKIIGYSGYNLGIGYSERNYFEPLKYDAWNSYWYWGTLGLIVPYGGVGIEYINKDNSFSIGLFTIYVVPWFTMGFSF
ncbi:hypothetical protein OSSY52_07220 [Tepiditoga spiralis]|uniref:Uncharacterized protein n=1 Tax=Tepiditoga spiralis TaxID=2108365 RepID=A0A7G1G2L2_9BACT|nr:hypothetical protein [Tepiditoga spiralis]BBE30581.1 hypothetical protein OSSY52_07220 [Tepiditoga spiralis]